MKTGDRVKITTPDNMFSGVVMPSRKEDVVVLKLDNGYNVGIEKSHIKSMEISKETPKEKKFTKKEEKQKGEKGGKKDEAVAKEDDKHKKLPTIAILHTGGTIASRVDYTSGGVVASFTAQDFLQMFPEIKGIANIKTELVANMMSEDMRFSHYQQIARAAKKYMEQGVDGIIVGHGTDTLGFTAAALSFMFESMPVPILLVGSQRSSDRGSTDAALNLLSAAYFIAHSDFGEVGICMHERMEDEVCAILPATKTRKLHTSRRDAFKAVNAEPIARVDYSKRMIYPFTQKKYIKKDKTREVILKEKMEDKVGMIRTHPNMHKDVFEIFRKNKYKGLILESSGIGQAPTNIPEHLPIYHELKAFIASGGVVVLTSQCIFGRVHKDIYTNCRRLVDIGIIFGEDMLTETAFVKLSWLLANYPPEEVKQLIAKNLRGEINPRIDADSLLE